MARCSWNCVPIPVDGAMLSSAYASTEREPVRNASRLYRYCGRLNKSFWTLKKRIDGRNSGTSIQSTSKFGQEQCQLEKCRLDAATVRDVLLRQNSNSVLARVDLSQNNNISCIIYLRRRTTTLLGHAYADVASR